MEPWPMFYRPKGRWRGPVFWCVATTMTHDWEVVGDEVSLNLTVDAEWRKARFMWQAKRRARRAVRQLGEGT